MARWLLSCSVLSANASAAQTQFRIQRHRCPFRLSGRVRGHVAGAVVARAGKHNSARHRSAALPRSTPAAPDGRGFAARVARVLGVRIAQATRGGPWRDRRQCHGRGQRRRHGQVSPTRSAVRAATAWFAPECRGAGVRGRAGRAQGLSPRDRMPACAAPKFSPAALPGGGRARAGRRLERTAAPRCHRSGVAGVRGIPGHIGARRSQGAAVGRRCLRVVDAQRRLGQCISRGHGVWRAGSHDRCRR